jgi:hypothetical protein
MDRLANKVAAVNEVNRLANEFDAEMRRRMAPWLGKAIIRADGGLLKRFCDCIDDMVTYTPRVHISRSHHSTTCADFDIKINYPVGESTVSYYTVSVRVANVRGGVLEEFRPVYTRPTDYNVETIRAIQAEIKVARAVLHAAESRLSPFNEND